MAWFKVGKETSMKDGDLMKAKVGELEILIIRIKNNFYSTSCYCTHEDYDLSEGFVDDGKLICPNHFATFEPSNGSVVSPPEGSGDISPLKSYKTKVENGEVLVEVA